MAEARQSDAVCRDCLAPVGSGAHCLACGRPRVLRHPELHRLAIAHLDCDAFYAAVEKRDDPSLNDKPVIIGGGRRGVVSTACYTARIKGVRSAMPMFKALRACPEAVVIRPNMAKYVAVGREVRRMMQDLTPLVEPLSIDEAFLDLSGTEALHRQSAARTLAALAARIEREIGITISIGLSHNKFLAKVASDLDKPRGFQIIGRAETEAFLADRPVSIIWGVGRATRKVLAKDGIETIADLRRHGESDLMRRHGTLGKRLHDLAWGRDARIVKVDRAAKSISSETTFDRDISRADELDARLWLMCEAVSRRAKAAGKVGRTAVLKLKSTDFRIRTRNAALSAPTQLADTLYRTTSPLLAREADGTAFRLIGVGIADLSDTDGEAVPDLFEAEAGKRVRLEAAIDAVRDRFGVEAVGKGRALKARADGGDASVSGRASRKAAPDS